MFQIHTVAVLGASEVGGALALRAALAGCEVRLWDPSPERLEASAEAVRREVEGAVAAGALGRADRQRILDGILYTPDLPEAVTGADLAAHAGGPLPSDLAHLGQLLRTTAVLAAEAPAAVAALAAAVPQPGRVLGLVLAGPERRPEVVPAPGTHAHARSRAEAFASRVARAARALGPAAGGAPPP